jgi:hypothetical protein
MNELNQISTWRQGRFIDAPQYRKWTDEEKKKADYEERFLVRPSPTGNWICKCRTHEDAAWIAERLNVAATIEPPESISKMAFALADAIGVLRRGNRGSKVLLDAHLGALRAANELASAEAMEERAAARERCARMEHLK